MTVMAWLVICRDAPDSAALRRDHLRAHLAYIEKIMERISVAGPLFADAAGAMNGSCFIYGTDDPEEARRLLRNDPYYLAGVYEHVEMRAFRPVAGDWVGGAAWEGHSSAGERAGEP